jgi:hypothetical protein
MAAQSTIDSNQARVKVSATGGAYIAFHVCAPAPAREAFGLQTEKGPAIFPRGADTDNNVGATRADKIFTLQAPFRGPWRGRGIVAQGECRVGPKRFCSFEAA